MDIHSGKEVNLKDKEINEIKSMVKDPKSGFLAFVRKAILDYIEETQQAD